MYGRPGRGKCWAPLRDILWQVGTNVANKNVQELPTKFSSPNFNVQTK